MDLSLKGSQINLAIRQKPKPKEKFTNLVATNRVGLRRPQSANIFEKSSRSLWRIRRPQSADSKFYKNFYSREGAYVQENDFTNLKLSKKNQKRSQSISSSSLLKLLLDEPIKRPWLYKESSVNSDGDSELSSSHKSGYNYLMNSLAPIKINKLSGCASMLGVEAAKQTIISSEDNLIKNRNLLANKPDLPGRVSFSNSQQPDVTSDHESSDYENGTAAKIEDNISAPGPVETPNYNFTSTDNSHTLNKELSSLSLKKSVHFGGSTNGEDVLAQTFEYPKCPSENCSCSTRSSTSSSQQDCPSSKCICDSTNCKYFASLQNGKKSFLESSEKLFVKASVNSLANEEESQVIRDYKNVMSSIVQNSVVKNLYEHKSSKATDCKAVTVADSYYSKYSHSGKSLISESLEKPNNLMDVPKVELPKKDLLKMDNKLITKPITSTSNSVINNYLKVVASTSSMNKKKENNNGIENINNGKKSMESAHEDTKKCSTKNKTSSSVSTQKPNENIKKAKSFGNLREDSNLDEFDMDKVDSWMSMHDTLEKKTKSSSVLDETFENFTRETLEAMKALDSDIQEQDKMEEQARNEVDETKNDSQDDSTYDEIVSVIKEIEEDKKKDNYADGELDLKFGSTSTLATARNRLESNGSTQTVDKYQDILSYLDNVEDSCEKTLLETRRSMPDTNRSEIEFIVEPDVVEDVPKLSDLLMLPNHQLARRVVGLSLRSNELANALLLSKEHVMKIRTEKQKSIRSEKANAAQRMREQKKHYESIVQRHQNFIEQLLKDKGSLCEKVAALTRRLESQNQAWEHKLETEISRVRDNTLAAEKIRRERWVRENTKKIKELTVKGLEAEINRMTVEHQREVNEIKREHQQQLLDAVEETRTKYEQIENSIRETCAQDRETIIAKERNAIRERFEKQLAEERQAFDEQKQKLLEDFQQEREKLWQDLKTKDMDFQNKRLDWQKEKEEELQEAIADLQEKMSKQEEKYQNRLNTIEKQYEADFELWKKEYENECKLQQVERENNIRQHYRTERDRQIDAIVQRMDAEAVKNSEEFEQKYSRLKEKYEKDLEEIESVERSLREKYADTRNKLAESDAQVRNFQAEIKQLDMELEHSKKMCSDFLNEREQLRENLKSELQNEIQALKNERDQEIQQIHKRVQQAIEKKDTTIDILHKENGTLRERCLKLEAIIRQQRKDYCVK